MTDRKTVPNETLLPCPFCGCEAWLHIDPTAFARSDGAMGHRIECEGNCHAMTCWWHSEQEAIEAWNRRAPGWQEISTAPKDEKVLVLFDEPFFGELTEEAETGYFDSESSKWKFWLTEREIYRAKGWTHIPPLPTPPERE